MSINHIMERIPIDKIISIREENGLAIIVFGVDGLLREIICEETADMVEEHIKAVEAKD